MKKTTILCLLTFFALQNFVTGISFASTSNTSSGVTFTPAPEKKTTKKVPRIKKHLSSSGAVVPVLKTSVPPTKYREVTLIATAYYSPLPDQKYYLRNNHQAEVILNGKGTHGASGKGVFRGMIAAPKGYEFGTKIWIPGF